MYEADTKVRLDQAYWMKLRDIVFRVNMGARVELWRALGVKGAPVGHVPAEAHEDVSCRVFMRCCGLSQGCIRLMSDALVHRMTLRAKAPT